MINNNLTKILFGREIELNECYSISDEESKRINILKFIAIVFVVYIHSYTENINFASGSINVYHPIWLDAVEYGISQLIARCGVPMFFLISSVLLFKKKRRYIPTIKDKVRTLLIPYLIWNTAWIFVFFLLQSLPFTADYFSGTNILIKDCNFIDWLGLYGIGKRYPQDYPLWFVRDLMVVTLIFPLISYIVNKIPKTIGITSIILLCVPLSFPFKVALCWIIIGACIVKLNLKITMVDSIPTVMVTTIYTMLTVISLLFYFFNVSVMVFSNFYILLGIIFWMRISKVIYNNIRICNMFLKLGNWTFIIYVAHEMDLVKLSV